MQAPGFSCYPKFGHTSLHIQKLSNLNSYSVFFASNMSVCNGIILLQSLATVAPLEYGAHICLQFL